jgi:hypothetical protein
VTSYCSGTTALACLQALARAPGASTQRCSRRWLAFSVGNHLKKTLSCARASQQTVPDAGCCALPWGERFEIRSRGETRWQLNLPPRHIVIGRRREGPSAMESLQRGAGIGVPLRQRDGKRATGFVSSRRLCRSASSSVDLRQRRSAARKNRASRRRDFTDRSPCGFIRDGREGTEGAPASSLGWAARASMNGPSATPRQFPGDRLHRVFESPWRFNLFRIGKRKLSFAV